jgi:hypothetical protein
MREDIKLKKFRMIYKNINNHYCNDFLNVKKCCQKEGITPSTYYKICKTLNKRSVGTSKESQQQGGSKTNKKAISIKKNRDNEGIDRNPHGIDKNPHGNDKVSQEKRLQKANMF